MSAALGLLLCRWSLLTTRHQILLSLVCFCVGPGLFPSAAALLTCLPACFQGPFDTYFLEADSITGPYRMITYMPAFGPAAYFGNIPSKFVANATTTDEKVRRTRPRQLCCWFAVGLAAASALAAVPGLGLSCLGARRWLC